MIKYLKTKFLADDEALKLRQAGFGRQTKEGYYLNPLEAAYIVDIGFAKVTRVKSEMSVKEILKEYRQKKIVDNATIDEQYIIYKHLRASGRIVRFSSPTPQYFRVHSRGVGREQERPQTLIRLITKKYKVSITKIAREISVARMLRMELIFAFVDDKKAQFIKVSNIPFD